MTGSMTYVAETKVGAFAEIDFERLLAEQTPMIFKGLAADLPLVKAGLNSPAAAMDHLRRFYGGKPLLVFQGEPAIKGRFGYTANVDGFNFTAEQVPLDRLFQVVLDLSLIHI